MWTTDRQLEGYDFESSSLTVLCLITKSFQMHFLGKKNKKEILVESSDFAVRLRGMS